jgi:hypothetical protein
VGGNPQGLARAERAIGLDSIAVTLAPSPFGYAPDEVLREPGVGRLRYEARRARLLVRALRHFDVVHFNFGRTILPRAFRMADLRLLAEAGKVIAVTFQGDDVRQGEPARRRGGLSLPERVPDAYPPEVDLERRERAAKFARWAHVISYLNPDLAGLLPSSAVFMPYAHVDPGEWTPVGRSEPPARPIVVHAPSARALKGTEHVLDAAKRLAGEGVDFDLVLVEGVTQAEARAVYADASLAVDQLYVGWYGGFAVEAMALAVPVMSYIRADDLHVVPEEMRDALPIIRTTPDTILADLRAWLTERRGDLVPQGVAGRAYVERWHDPARVASALRERYEEALRTVNPGRALSVG